MSKDSDVAMRFGADYEPLKQDLKKASALVGKFGREVRQQANSFAKYGTAATAAGVAVTAALVKKQSAVIDSLAKTSDALGIATQKLQALHHVGELNGVAAEQLNKGLQRMEVRLGEAARKGGQSADALAEVGVSIEEILKLRPEQQIQVLAEAFGKIDNQAIRASLSTDLFGREGLKMMKVLTQLRREGVEPTAQKLEALGVTISRVDAAKVEAANDALFRATQVMQGAANTLTVELSPFIEEAANQFIAASEASGGFGDEIRSAIESGIKLTGKFADTLHGLKVVFKGIELVANGFGAAVVSLFEMQMTAVGKFVDFGIAGINKVIGAANKLPGVEIAKVDPFTESPFMQGLHSLGDAARDRVGMLRTELHDLAMQELPSDKVEEFLEAVRIKAEETGQVVAKSLAPIMGSEDDEEGSKESEALDKRLGVLSDFYSRYESIASKSQKGLLRVTKQKLGAEKAMTVDSFGQIFNAYSAHSKTMQKAARAYAVVDATISMYQGIAAGLKLGWPMSIPAVAFAVAQGATALSGIRGASSGGGGSVAAASSPSAAQIPQQAQPTAQAEQQSAAIFNIGGLERGSFVATDSLFEAQETAEELGMNGFKFGGM